MNACEVILMEDLPDQSNARRNGAEVGVTIGTIQRSPEKT